MLHHATRAVQDEEGCVESESEEKDGFTISRAGHQPRRHARHAANERGAFGEEHEASGEVLREVEAGDTATVTVAGRPVAKIVPIRNDNWISWERAKLVLSTPTDLEWDGQRREFGIVEILGSHNP